MLIELDDRSVAFIFVADERALNRWMSERNASCNTIIQDYIMHKLNCSEADLEMLNPKYLRNYGAYDQAFGYLDRFLQSEGLHAKVLDNGHDGRIVVSRGNESHTRVVRVVRVSNRFMKKKGKNVAVDPQESN